MNIKEIEKYYEISRLGGIYKKTNQKAMSHNICRAGYHRVHLTVNGKRMCCSIHRLVAFKFVKGYFDGAEVNHKDGNKSNNYSSNLEWVTHKENMKHAKNKLGRKMGKAKEELKIEMVKYLCEKYKNKDVAALLNTTSENITRIKKY